MLANGNSKIVAMCTGTLRSVLRSVACSSRFG
jgi:hypothetical protein